MPARRDRSPRSRLQPFLLALGLAAALPAAGADIVLYEHDSFGGRSFVADQSIPNFANVGFNDRAASVIIRNGTWQLCSDAYFRGRCVTLGPGEYPTLRSMALENQVSSARDIDWLGGGGGATRPGGRDGGARAMLYEGPDLSGRTGVIDAEVLADLNGTGFNDRASSLRIEGGYWIFCSDGDFQGDCRTCGPGDYATLPRSLNNRISSGRRIHDQYPYGQNPSWSR